VIITAENPLDYARKALTILKSSNSYADDWVKLRLEFFRRWQRGFIFSTSITINFFENIVFWLTSDTLPPAAELYDRNFKVWVEETKKQFPH
jgi:hypothetical protein